MNPAIPDTLLSDINNLADALSTDLGESLRSLVLYGGPVKNDLVKDTDRINLMIVLTDTHTATLDKVGNVLQAAKRGRQFQPMVLTEADLNSSTDVFPIKFLDMQQDYEVLKGEDVVKGLEIGRENLRHVFQITGQKQRFNETSSHILVSILVLYYAYGTFTNIRNLHHASYDFRLRKSFDH